jgi:hypothetical protein
VEDGDLDPQRRDRQRDADAGQEPVRPRPGGDHDDPRGRNPSAVRTPDDPEPVAGDAQDRTRLSDLGAGIRGARAMPRVAATAST